MPEIIEISLPDALVKALGAGLRDLPRRTLETLVAGAYQSGKITHAQVSEMLSLDRWQTDAFLKQSQANRSWESEEFMSDVEKLRSLSR